MKVICILFLLMSSPDGFSQDTLANVSIHTWAGGQCCSSGTDIGITLFDKWIQLDFDSLIYVSSSGRNVLLYPTDFHAVNAAGKSSCSFAYGWSSMKYGYDQETPGSFSYYGLSSSRFRIVDGETPKLKVYQNNKLIKEGKVTEQFSMTAYP
nr:hypothetical protein [uncultured Fluviicola sp.]